ncbi:uncharacterized protein B0H18DRAFT_832688, partial [Fomitopsis serialis]|uniref:uncharacterized protein n=1 Tax=Fomitopsis serialis TaxID=139415 RepID=UPI002008B025
PSRDEAHQAWEDISNLLRPPRKTGRGYKHFVGSDLLRERLEKMQLMLWHYSCNIEEPGWIAASELACESHRVGEHETASRTLRKWCRTYLRDRDAIPIPCPNTWTVSVLDEDLAQDIRAHLWTKGKDVKAEDIITFLDTPEIKEKYSLDGNISLATAKRWLHSLGYRWGRGPKRQYVDGHEREDVVEYRNNIFIPAIIDMEGRLRRWTEDGVGEVIDRPFSGRHIVIWYHDESTFYANDRRRMYWYQEDDEVNTPPKGEGPSIMVSDFISADYGWLASRDGQRSARM